MPGVTLQQDELLTSEVDQSALAQKTRHTCLRFYQCKTVSAKGATSWYESALLALSRYGTLLPVNLTQPLQFSVAECCETRDAGSFRPDAQCKTPRLAQRSLESG